jgi:adenylate cyclase
MERGLAFDDYQFDGVSGQLWSGTREVRLTPKAAAVLEALVTRAGELVSKEELLGAVWKDTAVSDDALVSCVQELRKALADDAKKPRFIETRHRRGYRFIARPTDLNRDAGVPARVVSAPSDIRGKPTIAVLPFANTSGDTDQEYFTQGITEDLITALSKHRSLLVITRTSTLAFKGRTFDVRRAGMELGADYVLNGSVAKSGQRLRIRAWLIEADVGHRVWAERYDRHLDDLFDVQDEVTASIAARIEPAVGSVERWRAANKPAEGFRAWDFFHLGMNHFHKSTPVDNEESQRLLRRAIDLDPTLAQAHAWLSYAMVLSMTDFDVNPDDQRLNAAARLAKKGVDLDDQDAVTHFAYGRALVAGKAYEGALAEFEAAAELNPTLAIAYWGLGDSLTYEGRTEEAIPYFEKAIILSPEDPHRWAFHSYRALAHLFARQFDRALHWAQKAIRVPHCHYWPFAHRVSALGHLQDVAAAKVARAELLQRKPEFSCAFARRRLFFIKDPAHLELYLEGLLAAGITM